MASPYGVLYGTTAHGGTGTCVQGEPPDCGTVFSITKAGVEKMVYSFQGGSDGAFPYAGLVNVGGTLYGTTVDGGGVPCGGFECGSVFSVTTAGVEKVVYSFHDKDGAAPMAGLILFHNKLYGTTNFGGAYGQETVFSITP